MLELDRHLLHGRCRGRLADRLDPAITQPATQRGRPDPVHPLELEDRIGGRRPVLGYGVDELQRGRRHPDQAQCCQARIRAFGGATEQVVQALVAAGIAQLHRCQFAAEAQDELAVRIAGQIDPRQIELGLDQVELLMQQQRADGHLAAQQRRAADEGALLGARLDVADLQRDRSLLGQPDEARLGERHDERSAASDQRIQNGLQRRQRERSHAQPEQQATDRKAEDQTENG